MASFVYFTWFAPWLEHNILAPKSLCLTRLCAAAHPHTVGNIIIGTPRLCQGLSAFVIDGIPFSLFLPFHYHTIHSHMHTRNTHTHTLGVGPAASVRSSLRLHCALMYLRILFCCSIVWVEIEAHHWERKVTEHISTKSPISRSLSVCERLCSLSICLSPNLFPALARAATHACTPDLCSSPSLLFIHSTSHQQTASLKALTSNMLK